MSIYQNTPSPQETNRKSVLRKTSESLAKNRLCAAHDFRHKKFSNEPEIRTTSVAGSRAFRFAICCAKKSRGADDKRTNRQTSELAPTPAPTKAARARPPIRAAFARHSRKTSFFVPRSAAFVRPSGTRHPHWRLAPHSTARPASKPCTLAINH
jgi:hypothetical protein